MLSSGSAQQSEGSVAPTAANTPQYIPRGLRVLTLDQLLKAKVAPREMLLGPWLPSKGLALVFAPRGVGKTHFALGVAYAVASGSHFLKWRAPSPRKVLVIDGEMPFDLLQERWTEIASRGERAPSVPDLLKVLAADYCEDGLPDLSTREGQDQLEAHLVDVDLIIIDNLSTLARTGKENESESCDCIQEWALRQRRVGRSVLFVHHAGKKGEQRGTSKREDVMDTVIKLRWPDDYDASQGCRFVVEFTKARRFSGTDAEAFEAQLVDGVWQTERPTSSRDERIIELAGQGWKQRQIAEEVGCSAGTVNRVLQGRVQCSTP